MSVSAYRSSRVILPTGMQEATVLVEGEQIAEVVRGSRRVAGAIDFGDRVLGPGLVVLTIRTAAGEADLLALAPGDEQVVDELAAVVGV